MNRLWACKSCGKQIAHDPIGTAAICTACGGTSLLMTWTTVKPPKETP